MGKNFVILPTWAARCVEDAAELIFWVDHCFDVHEVQVECLRSTLAHEKELRFGLQHYKISLLIRPAENGVPWPSISHAF